MLRNDTKLSDFLSKPLISLSEGRLEGFIKNASFNKNLKSVEWLIAVGGAEEERALRVSDVFACGEHAVIVKTAKALKSMEEAAPADNNPINAQIFNTEGKLVGTVEDVALDAKFNVFKLFYADGKTLAPVAVVAASKSAVVVYSDDEKIAKYAKAAAAATRSRGLSRRRVRALNPGKERHGVAVPFANPLRASASFTAPDVETASVSPRNAPGVFLNPTRADETPGTYVFDPAVPPFLLRASYRPPASFPPPAASRENTADEPTNTAPPEAAALGVRPPAFSVYSLPSVAANNSAAPPPRAPAAPPSPVKITVGAETPAVKIADAPRERNDGVKTAANTPPHAADANRKVSETAAKTAAEKEKEADGKTTSVKIADAPRERKGEIELSADEADGEKFVVDKGAGGIEIWPLDLAQMPERIICNYAFLLGRRITCDVCNQREEVIIKSGLTINAKIVEVARKYGRLLELTKNSV